MTDKQREQLLIAIETRFRDEQVDELIDDIRRKHTHGAEGAGAGLFGDHYLAADVFCWTCRQQESEES